MDYCNPVVGCLHQPICAADAGADAAPDGAPDLPPADGPAVDLPADGPALPDAPGPADGRPEAAVDAAGSPDGRPDAPVPSDDARAPDGAPPADRPAPDAILDAGSEQRPTQPMGLVDDAGLPVVTDGGVSDAVPGQDGVGTDAKLPVNKLAGDGCSCRLNSSSDPQESGWPWLAALALVAGMARRRRTTR
jgi:hypothetical protein